MALSRIAGEVQPTTARRNSEGIRATRGRTRAGAWICSGDRLPRALDADPVAVVRAYLSTARTASARALAAKAAVLIEPQQLAGKIVWPRIIP
jgi:hypothetical protein